MDSPLLREVATKNPPDWFVGCGSRSVLRGCLIRFAGSFNVANALFRPGRLPQPSPISGIGSTGMRRDR